MARHRGHQRRPHGSCIRRLPKQGENERPDFCILTREDWHDFVSAHVLHRPGLDRLEQGYIPLWKDGYKGAGVRPSQIAQHRERWDKIARLLQ